MQDEKQVVFESVRITEADRIDKGIITIDVIKAGMNKSGDTYYPEEVLKAAVPLFEGQKMYYDHPAESERYERPERSIRDWAAVLQNARYENDGIVADAVVVDKDLQEKLRRLNEVDMLEKLGVSIRAEVYMHPAEFESDGAYETVAFVDKFEQATADFVTEPGAGGVVRKYESDKGNNKKTDEDKKKMELEKQVAELSTKLEAATKRTDELEQHLAEERSAVVYERNRSVLKEALQESELPEAAQKIITESFEKTKDIEAAKAQIQELSDVVESVKKEVSEAQKEEGAPTKRDNGRSTPTEQDVLFETFKERKLAQGATVEEAERYARHMSQ